MTRRRWALLGAALLLVAALVGGRWSALQTAERAWAATLPFGAAYLHELALARLVQWAVALGATLWGVAHCYVVYRAIGSVQMPRRLGDIEIVEAVPHRLLVAITLLGGVLYGGGLAWAFGDVWRQAVLAGSPPHFGVSDSILRLDLGYYLGELPWARARQSMLLVATLSAAVLITALYAAIGSFRLRAGRVVASPHARTHLGLTLAGLALAFLWGARLDPAETMAGLSGPVTHAVLAIRTPGAEIVAVVALATALLSAAWGWWDRPGAVGAAWLALLVTMLAAYLVLPPSIRNAETDRRPSKDDTLLVEERADLERLAFGTEALNWLPAPVSPATAAATIPLWDPARVLNRAHQDSALGSGTIASAARLEPSGHWLVGLSPDGDALLRTTPPPTWESVHRGAWAQGVGPLEAREVDSGLSFSHVPRAPSATWFGARFTEYAVVDSGTVGGIPLTGAWRRWALAWALQAPELARGALRGRILLWRRDAIERFSTLAPFAHFDGPQPVMAGDSLWWVSWGYLEGETFPLVDTVSWSGHSLRYRRAGLVAGVNAVTGATRLWLAPRADSLATAWARILKPLIEPADVIPPALRHSLPYPEQEFAVAAGLLGPGLPDSAKVWKPLNPQPASLAAAVPAGSAAAQDTERAVWLVQGFVDSISRDTLGGVVAGVMTADGPRLYVWAPFPALQIPRPLSSDAQRRAGVLRLWPTDAGILTVQARFWEPQSETASPRLDSAYVALGPVAAGDVSVPLALRDLLRGPDLADSTPAVSLGHIRALFARMDSALAAGHVSRFGVLYDSLRAMIRASSRTVARPSGPR